MAFSTILERFIEKSPIPVMARAMIERVLHAERFDTCFDMATENQYTRDLLFSTVFELMSQVVFKTFPSINSAYKFQDISVSITSVYNKLNGMDPNVYATLRRLALCRENR